jgi:hypothetical protein
MRLFGLAFENNQRRTILLTKYREMMQLSGRQSHFNKFQEQQGFKVSFEYASLCGAASFVRESSQLTMHSQITLNVLRLSVEKPAYNTALLSTHRLHVRSRYDDQLKANPQYRAVLLPLRV